MDIEDFNFDFDEHDEARADMLREARLLEDEKPLDFEDADDCGDACKI